MSVELYVRLGEAIRRRRDSVGMTQAALGARVGLTRTSISNIENGSQRILLHHLIDLAYALYSSPLELLEEISPDPQDKQVPKPNRKSDLTKLLDLLERPGGAR